MLELLSDSELSDLELEDDDSLLSEEDDDEGDDDWLDELSSDDESL